MTDSSILNLMSEIESQIKNESPNLLPLHELFELCKHTMRLREALEKITELEKPGCYDNDPLGMGIVSNAYQVARKALEGT